MVGNSGRFWDMEWDTIPSKANIVSLCPYGIYTDGKCHLFCASIALYTHSYYNIYYIAL